MQPLFLGPQGDVISPPKKIGKKKKHGSRYKCNSLIFVKIFNYLNNNISEFNNQLSKVFLFFLFFFSPRHQASWELWTTSEHPNILRTRAQQCSMCPKFSPDTVKMFCSPADPPSANELDFGVPSAQWHLRVVSNLMSCFNFILFFQFFRTYTHSRELFTFEHEESFRIAPNMSQSLAWYQLVKSIPTITTTRGGVGWGWGFSKARKNNFCLVSGAETRGRKEKKNCWEL